MARCSARSRRNLWIDGIQKPDERPQRCGVRLEPSGPSEQARLLWNAAMTIARVSGGRASTAKTPNLRMSPPCRRSVVAPESRCREEARILHGLTHPEDLFCDAEATVQV